MIPFGLCAIIICLTTCSGELEQKVGNGHNKEGSQFPYVVALQINGVHSCTGSILDKRHVLTAAHCVIEGGYPIRPEQIAIRYGTAQDEVVIRVESYCYHDDYIIHRDGILPHDIAILKLNEDIILSNNVKTISLPEKTSKLPMKTVVRVARWHTSKKKEYPDSLRQVDVRIYESKKCKESFDVFHKKFQFCAGSKDRKATCKFYTGGPLVIKENNTAILLGILSGGLEGANECGSKQFPGIYLKVHKYIDWIHENWDYHNHNEL